MKTPPKDGTQIIAEFSDYPQTLAVVWNGAGKHWAAAAPHCGPYNGVWDDWYYETESFADIDLLKWWPMPKEG